jgi:thiamine-monophosphate kinase
LKTRVKDIGEIGLIRRYANAFRLDRTVKKGIGDDTAVIEWTKDKYLLFTCDMNLEGVHFKLNKATPFQIGWKALARNVSDIAAMGGEPKYALISIGLDPKTPVKTVDGIYKGIKAAADKFGVNVVGGDTSHSGKLVIDISLIGQVEKKNLVGRNGAKKGDAIFVTGEIGGSYKRKHLDFIPRIAEARALVKKYTITSMIDISDGFLLDLSRVLDASRAGARITKSAVPVSRDAVSFDRAVTDGEDFELLFTMRPEAARDFLKSARPVILESVSLVGEIMDRPYGIRIIEDDGIEKRLSAEGYLHF